MATIKRSINRYRHYASIRTLTDTVQIPGVLRISSINVNPAVASDKVTYTITGDEVTVTLKDVNSTRFENDPYTQRLKNQAKFPDTLICEYDGGASTTYGVGSTNFNSNTCPSTYTTYTTLYNHEYEIEIVYETNTEPTITLSTTNNRTLYENDTYDITGNSKDADVGNIVSVKYSLNGGTARAISTAISTGADIPFSKVLTFKNKRLYDGATSITADLAENTQHTLRVWAEDDKGGRSADVVRTFQVVANRAPVLTLEQVTDKSDLIDTDSITFKGAVSDLDGNSVVVEYRVGGGSFAQVYSGLGGSFTFNVQLKALKSGDNPITVRATDSYGAVTTRNLSVTKSGSSVPLKESVQRYKITPPNISAQGIILWIERDVGDLIVSAEISMTSSAEAESFVPMTKNSTAFVGATREEDEFQYEGDAPREKIILKLTMKRADTASPQAIRLVSGVLS